MARRKDACLPFDGFRITEKQIRAEKLTGFSQLPIIKNSWRVTGYFLRVIKLNSRFLQQIKFFAPKCQRSCISCFSNSANVCVRGERYWTNYFTSFLLRSSDFTFFRFPFLLRFPKTKKDVLEIMFFATFWWMAGVCG